MTEQHPITPPPELVEQWRNLPEYVSQLRTMSMVTITTEKLQDIATQAARWGADQQLDQDAKWLDTNALFSHNLTITPSGGALRQVMRPKPPSLKEQALSDFDGLMSELDGAGNYSNCAERIRRALEQLDD